jgi:hypothetical protein
MSCQYYAAHLEQSIGAKHDHDTRLEESNLDVGMQNMQFYSCLRAQWSLEY